MHADSGNFSRRIILSPHAGEAGNALGYDAEVTAGANKDFFQFADKIHRANARIESPQIENGIADKLAGAVKSHVTTAVGFMQLNAVGGQELPRSNDVLLAGIAAKSDHWRVF